MLAEPRLRHPALSVELITDTRNLSLSRRGIDIAVRFADFKQHETVNRKVGDMASVLYGPSTRGTPRGLFGNNGAITDRSKSDSSYRHALVIKLLHGT